MGNNAEEYRRWERICLEQAELCRLKDARAAYRSLAGNYRAAAEAVATRVERSLVPAYFVNVSDVILLFIRSAMRRASSKVVPSSR
jgi:hypothetical protein